MDIFLLYLFTRVDSLRTIAEIFCVFGIFIFVTMWMPRIVIDDDDIQARLKWPHRVTGIVALLAILTLISVPSQKDLALIVGGKLAIEAVQTPTAKKVYTIVEDMLDQQLTEIAKKRGSEKEKK